MSPFNAVRGRRPVRSTRLLGRALPVVACLVGLLADASVTSACSPQMQRCFQASAIPGEGASVPANVPAFYYWPGSTIPPSPTTPDGFELRGPDGALVDVTFSELSAGTLISYLVRPTSALQPGQTYRIRHPQVCANGAPVSAVVEQSFLAGPAVPLPTVLGTASMTGHRLEKLKVWTSSGSCYTDITAALAHVSIVPSAELRAYLVVAQLAVEVNGRNAPTLNYRTPTGDGAIEFDVYAGCAVTDPGASRGLAPGKYKLDVRASILGASVAPLPISTDIELRCDATASADAAPPPPATPDGGASSDAEIPADAAVSPDGRSPPGPGRGGGCHMAGAAGKPPLLTLPSLLVVLLLRRRNRARARPDGAQPLLRLPPQPFGRPAAGR